jgi:hypothetical protein
MPEQASLYRRPLTLHRTAIDAVSLTTQLYNSTSVRYLAMIRRPCRSVYFHKKDKDKMVSFNAVLSVFHVHDATRRNQIT